MGSLKFSISLEAFDSKKLNSNVSSSSLHVSRASKPNLLKRVTLFKVNQMNDEMILSVNGDLVNESAIEQKPVYRSKKEDRFGGGKKERKREMGLKVCLRRNRWERELESLFVDEGEIDVNYSVLRLDLSLELCNGVLKRLGRCDDGKSLRFFEWMRRNGKLEGNVSAYNLVFRVLGRREDWETAEKMILEMKDDMGCDLNYQIFNTLIYACWKLGRVKMGAKWFRMMLEHGVQPNVATFGMLMGLYQKGWNFEEAEFTFSHMRNSGIVCQSAYSAMITAYTRLNLYEKAEEVIGLMKEDKLILY